MKNPVALLLIALFFSLAPPAQGHASGDVGSPECLEVQIAAQDAVLDGQPYRNHGQMVRTAAHVTSQAIESGEITEECASCIVSQFARGITIAEQEQCGPEEICPTTVAPDEYDRWYESGPFSGYDEVRMVATFTSPHELDFDADPTQTFQLWIIPKVPCDDEDPDCPVIPAVTIHQAPMGVVLPGSIITYDLAIDVSEFSSFLERFALRPVDHNFGTMSPSRIPFQSVSFTCNGDSLLMAFAR